MKSSLEINVIYADDDLRIDKVQWQWRGKVLKNGSSDNLIRAYDDATDAYIKAHE
jgi:hypothetical protein